MQFLVGLITRSPWGIQMLLYVVAALVIICIGLGVTLEIQSERLDTAKAKITVQNIRLHSLGDKIKEQNAAVDQMLANAAQQAELLKAAEKKAAQVRVITQERIEYVQTAVIPVACPEAITWGATHAIEIGRRWEQGGTEP